MANFLSRARSMAFSVLNQPGEIAGISGATEWESQIKTARITFEKRATGHHFEMTLIWRQVVQKAPIDIVSDRCNSNILEMVQCHELAGSL
jgi:hypothetical protein